ncbi:protein COP1 SUPPRESSOR 2-like [Triticum dicoccoides]|uniref:protein COP1 SUPPRESSOR 2-like n=1 Tax=Triticum dicoccoides TaxID=85692 RepID=UPI000E7BD4D9|nr:protein COP1 SUPPRESSOR 2-like [Triticum dicoccoides]
MVKNFRKRSLESDAADNSDDEDTRRVALEEVRYMQKLRERKLGIPAASVAPGAAASATTDASSARGRGGSGAGAAGEEDLVLQDTFAQETAVTIEDPNMLRYVENELLKKRGKTIEVNDKDDKDEVDELYVVPDHLKVRKKNMEESSTQWTTGIAEVQLPIEYKLRNIEETEAAKKMLQERRLAGKTKSDANIPSSYSADYFHRGRDYAEKLRREHPESYKGQDSQANETGGKPTDSNNPGGPPPGRREAATDELLLERFRKREKFRVMRR